jgi:predicted O-methyltransferase YrrM
MPLAARAIDRVAIPPPLLGAIDYYARFKSVCKRTPPLNGQVERVRILDDLFCALDLACVVETGTFRGSSTEWFAQRYRKPVYTCEEHPRFFVFSRLRLKRFPNVHLAKSDSRAFLQRLACAQDFPDGRALFYLDAHWGDDLPLVEELHVVFDRWRDAVVVVDDFAVPDDPGYGYDDYGPEKRLELGLLRPLAQRWQLSAFFPVVRSDKETGGKRGCVVLCGAGLSASVAQLPTLRPVALAD